ncbi:sensor histidine kinase [Xanthovirga aplysinae]|uniref:sensor histidine kinase n=1 Tax=Xanthovirga aplysinae TaxID=2529853 RepID=UPI0012BD56A2|nr:ATP-binding protein [Xanthovirga aplysinae]MTI32270.1 GHKL domain-containing protein [Xanthovirga aplysinae]
MDFKNFKFNVVLRIIVISLNIFLFSYTFFTDTFFLTKLLVFGLLVYQVYNLLKFLDKTNQEVTSFLNAISFDDFTQSYSSDNGDGTTSELNEAFNRVVHKFREVRAEKEAHYHYLKTIVQHVGIGLLTFDKNGDIQIINTAAKRLFRVNQLKNINGLQKISPELVDSFQRLRTGGRDLIKIEQKGETVQLAIFAIELNLRNKEFKLVSVQNIQSELEEKEMEAWQNLIRVLTHEIMNSVTPISSLAATVEGELEEEIQKYSEPERGAITKSDLEDIHLAIKTIQRRSEGLIRFVSDFRNLTVIPKPKPIQFSVRELFDRIETLMRNEINEQNIHLVISVKPDNLILIADMELIEQVLINLCQNAIHAVSEEYEAGRQIKLYAYQDDKNHTVICVKDNGSGIDEDAIKKIFIPFFTTKKTGSGIGLSLSKQIMRQHNGTISAQSKINEGTEFLLRF